MNPRKYLLWIDVEEYLILAENDHDGIVQCGSQKDLGRVEILAVVPVEPASA